MDRWQRLKADEQVTVSEDASFAHFVNDILPQILAKVLKEKVTPESLMGAQYLVVRTLAQTGGQDQAQYDAHSRQLSVFTTATKALQDAGFSPEDFLRRVPGFSENEISEITAGHWTIQDVMDRRPAVILRPLLAQRQH